MTTNVNTIDDVIVHLLGMGFELEDCQLAIKNGKLTVQAAVEWFLNGKPPCSSGNNATLKLNSNMATDMDTSSISTPGISAPSVSDRQSAVSTHLCDPIEMDTQAANTSSDVGGDLSSRLFVSDEQRRVKQHFEEKQRDEARRLANADKLAKKKAREEALKRIQEDRDKRKQQAEQLSKSSNSADSVSPVTDSGLQTATCSSVQHEHNVTTLQIRMPSGQTVKQSFASGANLRDVRLFVKGQCTQCSQGSFVLIQPFPRLELSEQYLSKTLSELGLVPSGSLVVKMCSPATPSEEPTESSSIVPDSSELNLINQQQVSHVDSHVDQNVEAAAVEIPVVDDMEADHLEPNDADDSDDDHENYDIHPAPGIGGHPPAPGIGQHPGGAPGWGRGGGFHPGFPPGGMPGFGGMGGFPGMGRGQPGWGHGQHNWGGGHRLSGDILENVVLPHQNQDARQLAAEAARRRYGTVPPSAAASEESVTVTSSPLVEISTLRILAIKYLTTSICSARQTFSGLHGIPSSLALQILDHVVKEGLLRPKHLQVFISCHLNNISLDSYPYCTNELLAALRHHIYLKHISLRGCSLITHNGLQHLTVLKNLKYLNIGSCLHISDDVIPVLIAMPSLVTLSLEDTVVTDAGVIQYAASKPPCLQNLDLSRTSITQNCFTALRAIPCLKQLNLEQTKVTGLSGIEGLTQLRALNLANTSIVTDSVLCIRDLSSLTALNLASTVNINGDLALQYITGLKLTYLQLPNRITTTDRGISFLTNMPLTMLDLTNFIYITDASLEYVGQISTLRKLLLSNTKITDAGLLFLQGLRDLEELHVDRTLVTDVGVSNVTAFPRLLELNLSNTSITNGLFASGALNSCRLLSKLNLSKTNISNKGMVRLRMPQLTMVNIDNTYCLPDIAQRLDGCPLLTDVVFRTLRVPPTNEDF